MQVLVRSALAGTVPVELDISAGFLTSAELPTAVAQLGGGRRYASLVAPSTREGADRPPRHAMHLRSSTQYYSAARHRNPVLEGAAAADITY